MLQAILGHNKKKSRIAFKISKAGAARWTGGTTFATTVRIGSSCGCLTLPLSLTLSPSLSLLLCNWFYSSEGGVPSTKSKSSCCCCCCCLASPCLATFEACLPHVLLPHTEAPLICPQLAICVRVFKIHFHLRRNPSDFPLHSPAVKGAAMRGERGGGIVATANGRRRRQRRWQLGAYECPLSVARAAHTKALNALCVN